MNIGTPVRIITIPRRVNDPVQAPLEKPQAVPNWPKPSDAPIEMPAWPTRKPAEVEHI